MIEQLLFTLFCTVFFCLGLNLTSQDGYLLDFLKHPFKKAEDVILIQSRKEVLSFKEQFVGFYYHILNLFASPLIMCITCMGSIWGVTWFILLNGFSLYLLPYMIINCFAASFIQTFIWRLYERFL